MSDDEENPYVKLISAEEMEVSVGVLKFVWKSAVCNCPKKYILDHSHLFSLLLFLYFSYYFHSNCFSYSIYKQLVLYE